MFSIVNSGTNTERSARVWTKVQGANTRIFGVKGKRFMILRQTRILRVGTKVYYASLNLQKIEKKKERKGIQNCLILPLILKTLLLSKLPNKSTTLKFYKISYDVRSKVTIKYNNFKWNKENSFYDLNFVLFVTSLKFKLITFILWSIIFN